MICTDFLCVAALSECIVMLVLAFCFATGEHKTWTTSACTISPREPDELKQTFICRCSSGGDPLSALVWLYCSHYAAFGFYWLEKVMNKRVFHLGGTKDIVIPGIVLPALGVALFASCWYTSMLDNETLTTKPTSLLVNIKETSLVSIESRMSFDFWARCLVVLRSEKKFVMIGFLVGVSLVAILSSILAVVDSICSTKAAEDDDDDGDDPCTCSTAFRTKETGHHRALVEVV